MGNLTDSISPANSSIWPNTKLRRRVIPTRKRICLEAAHRPGSRQLELLDRYLGTNAYKNVGVAILTDTRPSLAEKPEEIALILWRIMLRKSRNRVCLEAAH